MFTKLNRGGGGGRGEVDAAVTGIVHGVLHPQTLGVLMCTQTRCDCLHFVLERLAQHISCLGQCLPLSINVLPQLCKLLPLHLHGSLKIAHACQTVSCLFCAGGKCLYRLQEQTNANVTLYIVVRWLSVPAVHVHLAWFDAGWSMTELRKANGTIHITVFLHTRLVPQLPLLILNRIRQSACLPPLAHCPKSPAACSPQN